MKNFAERLSKEYDGTANPRSSKPLLQRRLVAKGSDLLRVVRLRESTSVLGNHPPACGAGMGEVGRARPVCRL